MSCWQNGKQVDEIIMGWKDKLMKWQVDKMAHWWNYKLMNRQVYRLATLQNGKFKKCQDDK